MSNSSSRRGFLRNSVAATAAAGGLGKPALARSSTDAGIYARLGIRPVELAGCLFPSCTSPHRRAANTTIIDPRSLAEFVLDRAKSALLGHERLPKAGALPLR